MTKKRKLLSQAEVWDDSALLQSWDEAVEEYQLYHSIYARGERVEDVLKKAATQEAVTCSKELKWQTTLANEDQDMNAESALEDGELEAVPGDSSLAQNKSFGHPIEPATLTDAHLEEGKDSGTFQQGLFNVPQTLAAGSSQDEGLKNLMMSWYWAGYYTGHYEGASQARQEITRSQEQGDPAGI